MSDARHTKPSSHHHHHRREAAAFVPTLVITVSDTRTPETDTGGALVAESREQLSALGIARPDALTAAFAPGFLAPGAPAEPLGSPP